MNSKLKAVALFFIVTCISVFLDVQVVRQILGFCFLFFVPGYLLLRLIRRTGKNIIETIVFSAGLSISWLMFIGLLLNHFCVSLNLSGFLAAPLSIAAIGSTFVLLVLCYLAEGEEGSGARRHMPSFGINRQTIIMMLWMVALCLLPIVGIVAALYHSSLLTIVMILGIAALFALSAFGGKIAPKEVFPFLILSASISLLFNTILVSRYLFGADVFSEFYVYKTVETDGFWHPSSLVYTYTLIDNLQSLLSITLLPAVYTSLTGISADVLFKVFYPLVFSLIPLVLYRMYEQQISRKSALMSVFFFISIPIAFFGPEPLSLDRQIVSQFFFIMSIFLLSSAQPVGGKEQVLLIIFGASIVVSHYSVAYIFLIYLVSFYTFSRIRIIPFRKASVKSLHLGTVVLMAVLTFSWYIYVSNSPFFQLEQTVGRITNQFTTDFLNPSARGVGSEGQGALQSLSPGATTTTLGNINKGLVYIENLFIGIGVLAVIIRKPDEFNLSSEYKLVAITSMIFLLLGFAVPNLATALNMTRFYAILIPFLSPFVTVGCDWTVSLSAGALSLVRKNLLRRNNKPRQLPVGAISLCIITFVLVTTFFFQTGLIGHITDGYPYSYSLDLERRETYSETLRAMTHMGYFLESEILSAKWLQKNREPMTFVYADYNSIYTVLKSYALLHTNESLQIYSGFTPSPRTYVYLKYLNVRMGAIYADVYTSIPISNITTGLERCERVYSNGDSEIYYSP